MAKRNRTNRAAMGIPRCLPPEPNDVVPPPPVPTEMPTSDEIKAMLKSLITARHQMECLWDTPFETIFADELDKALADTNGAIAALTPILGEAMAHELGA